jgi:hypothetical protein
MRLVGDLDNPSRKLDTAALEKHMIENIFKNVIQQVEKGKLNVPDILGHILGGN